MCFHKILLLRSCARDIAVHGGHTLCITSFGKQRLCLKALVIYVFSQGPLGEASCAGHCRPWGGHLAQCKAREKAFVFKCFGIQKHLLKALVIYVF